MEFRDSTGQIIRTRSTSLFTTPQAEGAAMKTLKDTGFETIIVDIREKFSCKCGGAIKVISEDKILHSCKNKYNPSETYYTGIENFVSYCRVQINPKLTNGEVKYNWFIDWESK